MKEGLLTRRISRGDVGIAVAALAAGAAVISAPVDFGRFAKDVITAVSSSGKPLPPESQFPKGITPPHKP